MVGVISQTLHRGDRGPPQLPETSSEVRAGEHRVERQPDQREQQRKLIEMHRSALLHGVARRPRGWQPERRSCQPAKIQATPAATAR